MWKAISLVTGKNQLAFWETTRNSQLNLLSSLAKMVVFSICHNKYTTQNPNVYGLY